MAVQIQSIERAATLLRLLTGGGSRGVTELAGELRLPKGTVYGILRTLERVGFVEKDRESGRYQLGPAVLHIGSSYLSSNELRGRARGCAEQLALQAGEAVRIGTAHDKGVLILHHVIGPGEWFRAPELGSLLPLHATALGKALLARDRHLAAEIMGGPLTGCTAATVTDPDQLRIQLSQAAERGWAGDIGEFLPGVASVAAAIEDRHGSVVGTIAISGPIPRICPERSPRATIVDAVMESARRISRELGASRW